MASYLVHKAIELDNLSKKALAAITDTDWVISPKYDGCHAVLCFEDGKHLATYSRSGELVRSMDHIAASLLDLYPLVKGRLAICGEAWMVGEEFNVISGAFRRHSPQPQLQFVPFDMVPFDMVDGLPVLGQSDGRIYPAKYIDRLSNLVKYRNNTVPSQVLVPRYSVLGANAEGRWPAEYTLAHALAVARGVALENKARTDSFFDGAILARANSTYKVGSGSGGEFIKIKPLVSYTVQVGAVLADVGSKTGKVTCVLCFDLNGAVQKVSTGLTQAQADEYVNNPNAILDQYIEVEAMGLTVNGLLREPRFKGIRSDV